MKLADVHCHLDDKKLAGRTDEVVSAAKKAGVSVIINNGVNHESNMATLKLSSKYDVVKTALGLYPLEIKDMTDGQVESELDFIRKNKNKIVAIGEVGLDYYWGTSFVERQKLLFEKVIALSEEIRKPLMIHSRKAEKDCFEMIQSSGVKKVDFHCYGGNMKLAKQIIDAGYSFSIPPSIVRSKHFQELVKIVPLGQLMTETDSPYLSPFAGKVNEPAFVLESVKKIAQIKGITEEDAANNVFMNQQRFF